MFKNVKTNLKKKWVKHVSGRSGWKKLAVFDWKIGWNNLEEKFMKKVVILVEKIGV